MKKMKEIEILKQSVAEIERHLQRLKRTLDALERERLAREPRLVPPSRLSDEHRVDPNLGTL